MSEAQIGLVLIALAIVLHFFWKRRTVAYTVHVQGRTEEAETYDFGIVLYEGESRAVWEARIKFATEIQERRRAFNNQRMLKAMEEQQKQLNLTKKTGNA